MESPFKARVALVHHWLVKYGGAERVVEALLEVFPQADVYTLVVDHGKLPAAFRERPVTASFLQRLPAVTRYYRKLLPLFPLALEQLCLDGYDLVISSESGPAKGVLTSPSVCHVCYCHSPMRYLWDLYHFYRNASLRGRIAKGLFTLSSHYLRLWDVATAMRVDYFVANSINVSARIRKHYRRNSHVIYPPVEVSAGYIAADTEDYYLVASRFVDYKRIDLAIEACNRLQRPLRIVGEGEDYKRLRRLAGPTVQFLGRLSDPELRAQYARCRALLFPGEEDFGIVPVEAQSFGRPVIAYGRGGALETVIGFYPDRLTEVEDSTGVFFTEQSSDSLVRAILAFETAEARFSPVVIRANAERFDTSRFKSAMMDFVSEKMAEFNAELRPVVGRVGMAVEDL